MGKTQQSKRFRECGGEFAFSIVVDTRDIKVRKSCAKVGSAFKSAKDKERKPKYKPDYTQDL